MKIIAVEPIGITTELAEEIRKKYNNQGHEFVYYPDRNEAPDVLIERMKEADIAILSNIKIDNNILSKCKNLKLLDIAFTGVDHIDIEYCKQNNISVCNASGYATTAVSELAIGLMLDVYRKISFLNQKTRELQGRGSILGCQLKNKTVGIVGTGAIGCETAFMLQKLSCNVIAYSRTVKAEIIKANIPYVSLEELMERSDIISLHTPLNPSTYHLISKDMLKLCKPSAILINTARGNVVDIDALAEALKNNKIAGAGIDVFEKEPPLPESHPLLNAPNCIVLPHVGYATYEAFEHRIKIILDNIDKWLEGNTINKVY